MSRIRSIVTIHLGAGIFGAKDGGPCIMAEVFGVKRAIWIALALVVLVIGIDRFQWYTGRVPWSNMVARAAAGAPELRIRGQVMMYHDEHEIKITDLKPAGQTDGGVTYYRLHDWPDRMPGGWLYIPKSDGVSYRYSSPNRPGWI